MLFSLFLKGLIVGFSIAMPVGPIGLLCIRNTLTIGFIGGVLSGLGAAAADALFGGLAGLGVSAITAFLEKYNFLVHTIGAIVLIVLGIHIMKHATPKSQKEPHLPIARKALRYAFFSTFFLTLVNPLTILSYAAMYVAIATDITPVASLNGSLLMALGVFVGSTLWWLILSSITTYIKHRLDTRSMIRINKLSGGFLLLLGVGTWIAAFF